MSLHLVQRCLRYVATRGCLRRHNCLLASRERFTHFSANIHPPLDLDMPPDYELQSYWNARFQNELHFEWLGDGSDTILPHLRSYLQDPCVPSRPARLLHIGAGTSSLSERIRELYRNVYGPQVDERAIVNVDFAENLVAREREKEAMRAVGGLGTGMRWVCADALKWRELEAALDLGEEGQGRTFDLVVDKSTSDAISCAEDVSYLSPSAGFHRVLEEIRAAQTSQKLSIPPVELLAVHLASLTRPGGLWVALTFSSNRFAFLSSPGQGHDTPPPHAAKCWEVERVVTTDAPTRMEGTSYAPVVQHYVFLIRRKDT